MISCFFIGCQCLVLLTALGWGLGGGGGGRNLFLGFFEFGLGERFFADFRDCRF